MKNTTTKTTLRYPILALLALAAILTLTGCERSEIRDAKLDGTIVTDTNGRKWMLKHHIGDTYFLYSINADGSINFPQ